MSRCVPSWGDNNNQFTDHLHDPANPPAAATSPTKLILSRNLDSNVHNSAPEVPNKLDYEVAELTWENGQLALHGLGQPRIPSRLATSSSAATTGTLESIVNQATCFFNEKHIPNFPQVDVDDELVPWFHQHSTPAAASAAMTMDALVPLCPNTNNTKLPNCPITCEDSNGVPAGGVTTHVESCSTGGIMKSQAAARHEVPVNVTRSEYSANSSRQLQVTLDSTYTDQRDQGTAAFTSTTNSIWSADNNTSSGMLCRTKLTGDDHDSISLQSRSFMRDDGGSGETKKKGSSSIKRSRAAAIHNQSERKRRDKINQRMKTLQKLVPNSNKTDKASMLDEVIEYLKQLQAQVTMVNRMNMNIPQMTMMPMTLNQQALQMSMMTTPMGMGGMLDMNAAAAAMAAGRANMAVPVQPAGLMHPSAFMPMQPVSWDQTQAIMPDPMSAFLPCQSQPMTMESYRMMASLYQQMQHTHHQLNPNSKS